MRFIAAFCLLLAAMTLAPWTSPVQAQEKDTSTATVVQDPFALYRKLGRVWVRRTTMVQQGRNFKPSYMDYEVIEVGDQHAVVRCQAVDSHGYKIDWPVATDLRVEFSATTRIAGTPVQLKVAAGEFPAVVAEAKVDDLTFKLWYATQYGGLLVKSETPLAVTELVKFHVEARPKVQSADGSDPFLTYRKEGRSWTHHVTGDMTLKTTIKNVQADSCEIVTEMFDAKGNSMGAATTMTLVFWLPDAPEDENKPVIPESTKEKVKCKAGEYDCISYDKGKTWMMEKYPGIIVKSEHMELIEFKE